MSNINKAILKVAKKNPEFRKAIVAELSKTSADPMEVNKAIKAVEDYQKKFDKLYQEIAHFDGAVSKLVQAVGDRKTMYEFDKLAGLDQRPKLKKVLKALSTLK